MAAKVLNWCCLVKVLKNECTLCKGARVCEHESKMATASVLSKNVLLSLAYSTLRTARHSSSVTV